MEKSNKRWRTGTRGGAEGKVKSRREMEDRNERIRLNGEVEKMMDRRAS